MFCLRKLIVQSTSTTAFRNFTRHSKKLQDPGISRRKRLVKPEDNEDITDFEDLESDFMEVHKSHREYERELEALKERQKYLIVKQKDFKEKYPNFLTWHDKEQIRYLHRSQPEEWTIERLSEGFPALPGVIKKIVKSHYTKKTQNKITNHDHVVQKNWNVFKEGKIQELPPDLVEHLKKFTNRALNFKPFVLPESQKEVKIKTTRTDFADIIKSYEQLKQPVAQIESQPEVESHEKTKNKIFTSKRSLTLSQLHANLSKRAEMGKEIDEVDKHIVTKIKNKENKAQEPERVAINPSTDLTEDKRRDSEKRVVDMSTQKYQSSTSLKNIKKTERDLAHLNYPEKINIPKKLIKKGFIYKLNDCYYDGDGEFLYRVPGMC